MTLIVNLQKRYKKTPWKEINIWQVQSHGREITAASVHWVDKIQLVTSIESQAQEIQLLRQNELTKLFPETWENFINHHLVSSLLQLDSTFLQLLFLWFSWEIFYAHKVPNSAYNLVRGTFRAKNKLRAEKPIVRSWTYKKTPSLHLQGQYRLKVRWVGSMIIDKTGANK